MHKIIDFKDRVQRQLKVDIKENLVDVLVFDTVDIVLDDLFEELIEYKFDACIELICENNKIYLLLNNDKIELLKQDESNFNGRRKGSGQKGSGSRGFRRLREKFPLPQEAGSSRRLAEP